MTVATAVAAVGLAVLAALPGAAPAAAEGLPGAGELRVRLSASADEERLGPGDRIHYVVRVRNSGTETLREAEIVQFLPPTMRYVSGSGGAGAGEGRVTWTRSLRPGELVRMRVTGEITGVRDGGEHPVTTVCARPAPDAVLVSCDAAVHRVHAALPLVWVVTGLAFGAALALCVGAMVRHRHTHPTGGPPPAGTRPAPEPATGEPAGTDAEPVPAAGKPAEPAIGPSLIPADDTRAAELDPRP
ncbi:MULTISPECIES: DUF11 domain-containing protein [unclassified Nocardiopsis]|uniref:DUF11 domain-containing protein n=1 Tax=unclassified Nocardiopsis TaxID=2649073 RepID=UPI0013571CD0|nr:MULTISPECIES: DUF11 domain-containing protein [unclassified Nocardiopsis]